MTFISSTGALVVSGEDDLAARLEACFAGHIEAGDWLPLAKWIYEIDEAAFDRGVKDGLSDD